MKTAYELAMERLNKTAPATKISSEQKRQIADLNAKYSAKIAEMEIATKDAMKKALESGEYERAEKLNKEWAFERKRIQEEWDVKKEHIRNEG